MKVGADRSAGQSVRLRRLDAADARAFQELRLRWLAECPSAFVSSYDEERDTPLATIAERVSPDEDRAVFGAFDETALQGIVGVRREAARKLAHKALIWGMYVAPPARRSGVGREIMTMALQFAATELRVRQVNLGVNASNVAAIALYERLGFTAFGLEKSYMLIDGIPQDEMHMVCVLESNAIPGQANAAPAVDRVR